MAQPDDREHENAIPESARRAGTDSFVAMLYEQLRLLAGREIARENAGHTLSATALVHEAYVRLAAQSQGAWSDRGQFFAIAATTMRRVLVDHARGRNRVKRGGGEDPLRLSAVSPAAPEPPVDVLALDEALTRLAEQDPDAARVVEMRFFAGLPEAEIAEALGVTDRTVRRHWTFAKAWLARELQRGADNAAGGSGS